MSYFLHRISVAVLPLTLLSLMNLHTGMNPVADFTIALNTVAIFTQTFLQQIILT